MRVTIAIVAGRVGVKFGQRLLLDGARCWVAWGALATATTLGGALVGVNV